MWLLQRQPHVRKVKCLSRFPLSPFSWPSNSDLWVQIQTDRNDFSILGMQIFSSWNGVEFSSLQLKRKCRLGKKTLLAIHVFFRFSQPCILTKCHSSELGLQFAFVCKACYYCMEAMLKGLTKSFLSVFGPRSTCVERSISLTGLTFLTTWAAQSTHSLMTN